MSENSTETSTDEMPRTKHRFSGHVKVIAISAFFGLAAYGVLLFVIWGSGVLVDIYT